MTPITLRRFRSHQVPHAREEHLEVTKSCGSRHSKLAALSNRKPQERGRRLRVGSRRDLPAAGRDDY